MRQTTRSTAAAPAARSHNTAGISIAPPAYKLAMADQETAQADDAPVQGIFGLPEQQSAPAIANNTGLPDQLKTGIEQLSGYAMDDVKVHYNSPKPATLQANAYAQGTDIHLAPGQEKHLPHEAWHVVQQKQGRVKATIQMKGGVNVNDDKGLEKEADVMGGEAMQGIARKSISNTSDQLHRNIHPVVQCDNGMTEEVNLESTQKRYEKGRSFFSQSTPTSKEKIVSDAILVRNYLRDIANVVRPALRQLELDILEQFNMSSAKEPNSRHLTRALAVREKQCGLESTQSNYTRLLSSADFTKEAAKGALFNDWGAVKAALTHGEFTHRIQWYTVMYAMSAGFTNEIHSKPPEGFNHTPKQLLIAINVGGVTLEQEEVGRSGIRPTKQKDGHGLWDVLFDRPSLGIKSSFTQENEEIGITDPERFMIMLDTREENIPNFYKPIIGHLKGEAPNLSRILSRRQALRQKQNKNSGLNPEAFEKRKEKTGRYTLKGKGLLVRNQPQSLVGSKAKDQEFVPYAPKVRI